jgi:hypothetical protein
MDEEFEETELGMEVPKGKAKPKPAKEYTAERWARDNPEIAANALKLWDERSGSDKKGLSIRSLADQFNINRRTLTAHLYFNGRLEVAPIKEQIEKAGAVASLLMLQEIIARPEDVPGAMLAANAKGALEVSQLAGGNATQIIEHRHKDRLTEWLEAAGMGREAGKMSSIVGPAGEQEPVRILDADVTVITGELVHKQLVTE